MELKKDLSMTGGFFCPKALFAYTHVYNTYVTWLYLSECLPHSAAAYVQMPPWNAQADILS
jgi:hypothetical protein